MREHSSITLPILGEWGFWVKKLKMLTLGWGKMGQSISIEVIIKAMKIILNYRLLPLNRDQISEKKFPLSLYFPPKTSTFRDLKREKSKERK